MQSVDRSQVDKIVYETSKGTKFMNHALENDKKIQEYIFDWIGL